MSLVDVVIERHVMTITLNDEPRRNALSDQLLSELIHAITLGDANDDVRVVVLTNAGTVFCSGANMQERSSDGSAGFALSELLEKILDSPKVFVGRIKGHCRGGGVGLAAVLDISVASDEATFGFSEVRLGVAPAIISVVCLTKMRLADAQNVFLRGQGFDASEAARIGLITMSVAATALDATVKEVVNDLLAGEPGALAATKELLASVPSMPRAEAFAWTTSLSASLFSGAAAKEGISAFREKRPAAWVTTVSDE